MSMEGHPRELAQTITDIASPLAASLGLAIWGVEVVPAGRIVIRVYAESLEASQTCQSILEPLDEVSQSPCPADAEAGTEASSATVEEVGDNAENEVHQGGISVDQCAELSRLLGLTLEVENCEDNAYVLEVSSPGLNRLFFHPEQLERAIDAKVEATLVKPVAEFPGRRKFIGVVTGVAGNHCTLAITEPEDTQVTLNWPDIKKIRQIYVAPEKKLPGKSPQNTRQKKNTAKKKK